MVRRTQATRTVKPLRNGQITIPIEFRRQLGIDDESILQIRVDDGELRIRPIRVATGGSPWLRDLYECSAPAREEAVAKGFREEEIDSAVDAAIEAVRRPQPE